jgi:hypothetical protein
MELLDNNIKIVDRNAAPAVHGWCFQVGAGISH